MANDTKPVNIKPSMEDKQRLDTLSKEISERLDEFSSIISKTFTKKTDNTLNKISFERSRKGITVSAEPIPVIIEEGGPPKEVVGYYCDPPGICQTTPC